MTAIPLLSEDFANNFETLEKQEEKKLRAEVEANPLHFDKWLELIKHIEGYVRLTQKSPDLNRSIYRDFLKEFPQCFGYWRKLADIYIASATPQEAEAVFEEAFDALPVSVEIWVRYCEWKFQTCSEADTRK